jgi:hypothetical protein
VKAEQTYIKYMFGAVILSLLTSGGFGDSAFVCFIVSILYLIDISNKEQSEQNQQVAGEAQIIRKISVSPAE